LIVDLVDFGPPILNAHFLSPILFAQTFAYRKKRTSRDLFQGRGWLSLETFCGAYV